jgi:signal transduction histidine kinase
MCCSGLRRAAWLVLWLLLALSATPSRAQLIELHQAQAAISAGGQTKQQSLTLPYHWNRNRPGLAGEASFDLSFELQDLPVVTYGLYIARLGNAYEVWLNGTLLQRNGDMLHYNGANFAKAPRHIQIAPSLLHKHNLIQVRIRADLGRHGGLSPLILGPDHEVYPLYLRDFRSNTVASFAIVIIGLLIGLMALALWATQVDTSTPQRPLRDRLYLFAGLAEVCAAFNASDLLIENTPLDWPWWGLAPQLAEMGWECSIIFFCVELAGWRQKREVVGLMRWLLVMLVTGIACSIGGLFYGHSFLLTIFDLLSDGTVLVLAALLLRVSLRDAKKQQTMVAIMVMLTVLVDLHHTYMLHFSTWFAGQSYQPVSTLLFGLALGFVVLGRFRWTSDQLRGLVSNMTDILRHKEQLIEQSYQRTEQLVREQERTRERARILRDMHDGVGSHISTAIRQLQSGKASQGEVLQTLRDSLDQLKLTIDAMNLPPGDITALLANLRYRLEPRLKASGIELRWDVDLLAPLERLDDKAMRHLQYMVFEAVSNVLQHANASLLSIELRSTPQGGALLRVVDNGCGFDPERIKSQGLRSLRERAATIGAQLQVSSVAGNTAVQITLN